MCRAGDALDTCVCVGLGGGGASEEAVGRDAAGCRTQESALRFRGAKTDEKSSRFSPTLHHFTLKPCKRLDPEESDEDFLNTF